MQETWVQSLGWEDPLEKGMTTHSSILAWSIPNGQRSLAGYSPWGLKVSDTIEWLSTKFSQRKRHLGWDLIGKKELLAKALELGQGIWRSESSQWRETMVCEGECEIRWGWRGRQGPDVAASQRPSLGAWIYPEYNGDPWRATFKQESNKTWLILKSNCSVCSVEVQVSCSVMSDSATPWTAACQASPSITNSWSLLKLMSIKLVMPSNHLILCRPLLLSSIFPSIRIFSNESVLRIRWPKYWSFSFSISPSNEHSGLISFRIDWFDLLAGQETLKSLQHYSSKASILQHSVFSAFFMVQLSHPYMTTEKAIALTRRTFVSKVMSLLLNMLSRLVIAFLPRSKRLLISWLQSPSAVILESPKIKSLTVSIVSPIYLPWSDETRCHDLSFLNVEVFFWMLSFKPIFSLSFFTFTKRLFSSSLLSAIKVVSSVYLKLFTFLLKSWFQLVLHPAWHFAWKVKKAGGNIQSWYTGSQSGTSSLFHVWF